MSSHSLRAIDPAINDATPLTQSVVEGMWGFGDIGDIGVDQASIRSARTVCRCRVESLSRGFTLIEVMVVIVILGVLASLVVPRVMSRPDEARVVAARQDIAALSQALRLYKLDNRHFPSTAQGLQALVQRPTGEPVPQNWKPYLERLPDDPWGHPYQYLNPGLRGEIDVMSFGADNRPGGTGFDADIGSWED